MESAISKRETGSLDAGAFKAALSIGELERCMLRYFPAEDACDWDRTGLLVGDRACEVTGVYVSLDPSIRAMKSALAAGCNVLLSHHPIFLDAPDGFFPVEYSGETPGSRVAFALSHGMACMNFHTALDVSREGLAALPSLLRLDCKGPLLPFDDDESKGFVMLCASSDVETLRLDDLASRCVAVNHAYPRVWGDGERAIGRIAVSGGSANSFLKTCLEQDVDCLVCGEVGYHQALDASLSGLSIIELGHDVSEVPLCAILAAAVSRSGVPDSCITIMPAGYAWHTPEATRR